MWLRLTDVNDKTVMLNSDHIVWFNSQPGTGMTELRCTYYGGDRNILITVKETLDDIVSLLAAPS